MVMSLSFEQSVAVITWDDGENRVNLDSLARLHEILDELESIDGPLAIVWTGTGKFFSNGLDLDRFGSNPDELFATLNEFYRTFARLLLFPAYTVGAINGHAFAAGALATCALDYRIMREDRGYWCMNEADIGFALDAKLAGILLHRLPRASAIDAMITARRFNADAARAAGIVEAVTSEGELLERAIEVAASMATKSRAVLSDHKRLAHGELAALLGFPDNS